MLVVTLRLSALILLGKVWPFDVIASANLSYPLLFCMRGFDSGYGHPFI